MSKFISGEGALNAQTVDHFNGTKGRSKPGAGVKSFASKWPNQSAEAEFLNRETGVNYKHNGAKGSYPRG